jgi:hypothetical protein
MPIDVAEEEDDEGVEELPKPLMVSASVEPMVG